MLYFYNLSSHSSLVSEDKSTTQFQKRNKQNRKNCALHECTVSTLKNPLLNTCERVCCF